MLHSTSSTDNPNKHMQPVVQAAQAQATSYTGCVCARCVYLVACACAVCMPSCLCFLCCTAVSVVAIVVVVVVALIGTHQHIFGVDVGVIHCKKTRFSEQTTFQKINPKITNNLKNVPPGSIRFGPRAGEQKLPPVQDCLHFSTRRGSRKLARKSKKT